MHSRGESEMHGAGLFGVAAVLRGGRFGRIGTNSERTLRVRNSTHAARAESVASLEIRSREG
ncbi:hypothetical protein EBR66_01090 [bacterium]|nr:hypothetical protein [bacterium]